MTQDDFAHCSGLNRNYVGIIECCENASTIDVIEKLAEALQAAPDRVFEDGR